MEGWFVVLGYLLTLGLQVQQRWWNFRHKKKTSEDGFFLDLVAGVI